MSKVVPNNLTEDQLQAAFVKMRADVAKAHPELAGKLDGHERICECADCAQVRDAALRQFAQLMEHQCLYYVIQVTAAMDAICKTALMRWNNANPNGDMMTFATAFVEHEHISADIASYMAHPDTMEVTWCKVQDTIMKQVTARR